MLHMPWRKWSTSSVVHKGSSVYIWCQPLGEFAPSISRWAWYRNHNIDYCNHKHTSWFGWDLVSTGTLRATKIIQYQTVNLWHSWWGGVEWLHQVSTGWIGAETTKADWSFCTIRWRWQCVVVINGNVWRLWINRIGRQRELRHNWSRYHLKSRNSSPSKRSMCNVLKNRWFHFSIYSPPLVVIGLSNIWSLHWIV